jgi:hypothetical protein
MKLAILLTGSIAPAATFVAVTDIAERRAQYLTALNFYRGLAPVFFLENSSYDLAGDADFALEGVSIRKFTMLPEMTRGKGYQEFAMMDAWYAGETAPPDRFLKITGRYLVKNVAALLDECRRAGPDEILIDRYRPLRIALTSLFSPSWSGYGAHLQGLHRQMDDSRGLWAEPVFYRALAGHPGAHPFAHEPNVHGLSGSTGISMQSPAWKRGLKQISRSLDAATGCPELRWRR